MPNQQILPHAPSQPDPTGKYLFYLHGLIIEEAGIRPLSKEHGYYEFELILAELAKEGFIVISEARPQGTRVRPYAEAVAAEIEGLLRQGVPPTHITIVGASKGGIISAYVSNILKRQELTYVILAGLFAKCLSDENLRLYGRVLSIHDRADSQPISPEAFFARSVGQGAFQALILDLDLGHGLLYQPYRQWIDPLLAWVREGKVGEAAETLS